MDGAWSAALVADDVPPCGVLTAILDHQKRGPSDSIVNTSAAPARCGPAVTDLSAGEEPLGGSDVVDGWKEAICGNPLPAYGCPQSDELDPQHKSTRLPPRSLIYTPHNLRPCQWALAAPARLRRDRAPLSSSFRRAPAGARPPAEFCASAPPSLLPFVEGVGRARRATRGLRRACAGLRRLRGGVLCGASTAPARLRWEAERGMAALHRGGVVVAPSAATLRRCVARQPCYEGL